MEIFDKNRYNRQVGGCYVSVGRYNQKEAPPKLADGPNKGEVSDGANDSDAASQCSGTSSSSRHRRKAGPKLPHFEESKDNIDSYLRRFEHYAVLQDWPAGEWALYLSALLKGRALEVYSRLTEEEAYDYRKLKVALLRKYELTAEGFRRKFYEVRREQSETAAQFTSRLMGYLDRWIQLVEIEQTFQGLKELMIREQFLHVSEDHLALYLRERSSRGLAKLVELADLYLDAQLPQLHRPKSFKDRKLVQSCPKGHNNARPDRPQQEARESDNVSDRRGGHLQSERVCYSCGQPGHIRKDCKRKPARSGSSNRTNFASSCRVLSVDKSDCHHDIAVEGTLDLRCGCKLPYVGCLALRSTVVPGDLELPVCSGTVNGRTVSVLRDTDCTMAVIRRTLVTAEQLTSRFKYHRMIDGTVRRTETALVHVESPYFTGDVECLCFDSPT